MHLVFAMHPLFRTKNFKCSNGPTVPNEATFHSTRRCTARNVVAACKCIPIEILTRQNTKRGWRPCCLPLPSSASSVPASASAPRCPSRKAAPDYMLYAKAVASDGIFHSSMTAPLTILERSESPFHVTVWSTTLPTIGSHAAIVEPVEPKIPI